MRSAPEGNELRPPATSVAVRTSSSTDASLCRNPRAPLRIASSRSSFRRDHVSSTTGTSDTVLVALIACDGGSKLTTITSGASSSTAPRSATGSATLARTSTVPVASSTVLSPSPKTSEQSPRTQRTTAVIPRLPVTPIPPNPSLRTNIEQVPGKRSAVPVATVMPRSCSCATATEHAHGTGAGRASGPGNGRWPTGAATERPSGPHHGGSVEAWTPSGGRTARGCAGPC